MPSRIAATILILLLPAAGAVAATGGWENHGPWGGLALRISVDTEDPDRVFVMTTRGFRLTEDGGASWRSVLIPGTPLPPPMSFARGRIWCSHAGAIRSSRDGRKWEPDGPVNGTVFAVGEAAGDGPLHAVSAVRGKDGACTFHILAQEDFGWSQVAEFPERLMSRAFPSVRVRGHPDHGKVLRVFVTDLDMADSTIVYGSDDGGKTWERWISEPRLWDAVGLAGSGVRFAGLALHPQNPPKGLHLTEDGGRTWKQVSTDPRLLRLRSIAAGPGNRLLLGTTKEHVLDTTPALDKIRILDSGLMNENVAALAIHPKDPKRVWAATQCGLFRSDDGGEKFAPAMNGFGAGQIHGLIAVDGRVLVFEHHQGTRLSKDDARSWAPLDLEFRKRFGKVFAVASRGKVIAASTGTGVKDWKIVVSRNGGESWSMRTCPGGALAVGVGPKGGVYVTRKGGVLQRVVTGVDLEAFASGFAKLGGEIQAVRAFAGGERLLLIGPAGAAICDAADGGNRRLVDPPVSDPLAWRMAALDAGNALYVTDLRGRLFRKVLPTGAWETVTPADSSGFLEGLVSDPSTKDLRYAAFTYGVVARSTDAGRTWSTLRRFSTCGPIAIGKGGRVHVVADGTVWTFDPKSKD